MNLLHPALPTRPRRAGVLVATATLVAAATVTTSAAASASATAPAVSRGAGASIAHNTDYVGAYHAKIHGKWVDFYCINPTKREPGQVSLSATTRVSGLSTTVSRELAEVVTAHGQTSSKNQAEAVSQALNYLAGNKKDVARRAHYIAKSVQKQAMTYVAEAQHLRGGYSVRVHLGSAPLPGQTGTGTLTLAAAGGAKATTVALSGSSNVSVPRAVRTNARGVATFRYTTTGSGEVHIGATANGLAPSTVLVSHPAAGYQQMVSGQSAVSAHASASYQGRVVGFSNSYACSTQCNGHPVVTLTVCAPASKDASRFQFLTGRTTTTVNFAAKSTRQCQSVHLTLSDGERVTGSWQYHTAKGWTAHLAAPGSFTVDCPAAPPIAVAMSYDCTSASVTVELGRQVNGVLTPQRNTTKHAMVLQVSGAAHGSYTLAAGATATAHTWPLTCGQHAQITVRSGIQRANHAWNYGQPAEITTP